MTELKPVKKKRKREEMSLKTKTYIGIGIFLTLVVLTFKVFIPYYARVEGQRMADAINEVVTTDHFEMVEAERKGIQFFSHFQSTNHPDLYISTDMAPSDLNKPRIRYLYDRALKQKPGTMQRFTMGTDDVLYDQLKPVLGDQLLRVVGRFGADSPDLLELEEPFKFGKLRTYMPTVDIQEEGTDENFIKYFSQIIAEMNKKDYGFVGLNIQFTIDRKSAVTYSWYNIDPSQAPSDQIAEALKRYRNDEYSEGFSIEENVYYDYSYNHDYTLPEMK